MRLWAAKPTHLLEIDMRKLLALVLIASAMLAGCNTIAGMGKDIESGGSAVEGAAKDVQKKM